VAISLNIGKNQLCVGKLEESIGWMCPIGMKRNNETKVCFIGWWRQGVRSVMYHPTCVVWPPSGEGVNYSSTGGSSKAMRQ
jgi:hypothetical protein